MKRGFRISLIVAVVLIVGYFAYVTRFQIEAKAWHWRHGYSIIVGDYEVPVPDHWLVQDFDNPNLIDLIDTRVRREAGPLSKVSVVTVDADARPMPDLSFWESFRRQSLEQRGIAVEEMTLRLGDERMTCLGGEELREILHVPSVTAVSLECRSLGRLSLRFLGPRTGLQDFNSIASQIHKRK